MNRLWSLLPTAFLAALAAFAFSNDDGAEPKTGENPPPSSYACGSDPTPVKDPPPCG